MPKKIHRAEPIAPLSKENAIADTLRALQECYPDRWERVYSALQLESEADKAGKKLAGAVASNPGAALGAALGALIGAGLTIAGQNSETERGKNGR